MRFLFNLSKSWSVDFCFDVESIFFAKNILKYEFHEYFSCFQRCFFRPNKGEEKIRYEFHYSVTHKHAHKWMRKKYWIFIATTTTTACLSLSLCACVWKFDFLIFKKNSHMESKLKNRKFLNSKLSLDLCLVLFHFFGNQRKRNESMHRQMQRFWFIFSFFRTPPHNSRKNESVHQPL